MNSLGRFSKRENFIRKKPLVLAIGAAVIAASASSVMAERVMEEVVVTATKRNESIQDVPLAITAISGELARDLNLDDVKDLIAFTPGVSGNTKDSFLDGISIRGIRTIDFGNGGDPSVSIYKNGMYQGRNGSAVSSLFDVSRAEILRGPQGFLFGRNSVSGAMNIITNRPNMDAREGYIELDGGERGHLTVEAALSLPVSEAFAWRLALYHSEEDGYVKNLQGGTDLISHDKSAFRLSGRFENDNFSGNVFFEFEDREQSGTVYRATGQGDSFNIVQTRINGGVPIAVPNRATVNNDNSLPSQDDGKVFTMGIELEYDLGWATLSSLTSFKDHEYDYAEDFDGAPIVLFNYGQDQEGDYFEQELRLTSESDGPLSWYAGVSYYSEDIDTIFLGQQEEDAYCQAYFSNTCQDVFDFYNTYYGGAYAYVLDTYFGSYTWTPSSQGGLINDRNRVIGKYTGYSSYVDFSYEVSDTLDVSVGLRYSNDEKKFSQEALADPGGSLLAYHVQTGFQTLNGPLKDTQDWSKTTWRIVGNWHPNDDTLLFGSVTTGYKPGGFGSFNIDPGFPGELYGRYLANPGTDSPADFGPETVTSYELGYKGTLFNGRAQLAINAFLYDYKDLQAIFGLGPIVLVDNIGQVDGRGLEVDFNTIVTDNIDFRVGISWFDSEADNVQAFCEEGERITGSRDACEGNSIPWAPEWTAFAILNASFPMGKGEIYGNLAWTWEDSTRANWESPSVLKQSIKGINQTDFVVGYRQDQWQVSFYAENLFDNFWYDGGASGGSPDSPFSQYNFGPARPQTLGLRFSYTLD